MPRGQHNEAPDAVREFKDFPGIKLLEDPIDLPPGMAQDQLNVKSDVEGQLSVRGGVLPISFDLSQ